MKIRSASSFEIKGCIQHIYNLRLAAKQVGRSGIFFVAVGTAEPDSGQIAVSNNEWVSGLPTPVLSATLTEFKTADTPVNWVVHYSQYGCYTGIFTGPICVVWCGRSEEVAVSLVAYSLSGLCI